MRHTLQPAFAILALATCLVAQTTTYYAPSGHATLEGNTWNTIPWWSGSATYQQVHDASDLAGVLPGPVAAIKAIGIRKDSVQTSGVPARTLDIQITLGVTTVTAATTSVTFATNLGPSPTIVLPYTNLSLPALVNASSPNPIGWSFPFATPFPYATPTGNLCWELRYKNTTTYTTSYLDVASNSVTLGTALGTGCTATGQTSPSIIGVRTLAMATGTYRNRLDLAAANAPATFFLGFKKQQITLPGLCGQLETLPLADVGGTTNGTGTWDLTLVFGSLIGFQPQTLHGQFVFLDTGLPYGIGLSNASVIVMPAPSSTSLSRVYNAPNGGTSTGGWELSTSGTVNTSYGFVTGFDV